MATFWIQSKASGTPRREMWDTIGLTTFTAGDSIRFDPFPGNQRMESVYASFVEYYDTDEHIAVIDVPSGDHQWFNEPAGEYLVATKYLTPQ